MVKSKVSSNNIRNSKLSKNNTNEKSIRDKIKMIERKSAILNNLKKNGIKVAMLILVLLVILIYTNLNKKIVIDEYTNISKLSSNKYSKEIVNLYNRDGQLDMFLNEMDRVQNLVGVYVISNSTLRENGFSDLIKTLNKEINNDKWVKLNSEKSKYYNGKYSIDNDGNVKFKFDTKKIEPSWVSNESISRYIILN
jgi:hypothetical protein